MDPRVCVLMLAIAVGLSGCGSSGKHHEVGQKFGKDAPAGTEYMIVIIRHGESYWNVDKPIQRLTGWYNVGLTPFGESQIPVVGNALKARGIKIDVGVSSVLNRSFRSLDILAKTMDIPEIKRSWLVNERHFGGLCGIDKDVVWQCWEQTNWTSWDGKPIRIGDHNQFYYAWDGESPVRTPGYPKPGPEGSADASCDWWAGKGVPEGVSPKCKDFLKVTCERNQEIINNTHPMGQQGVEHAKGIWKQVHEFAQKQKMAFPDMYPNGEMTKDVADRVLQYVESDVYPALKAGKRVVIMTHTHGTRVLMRYFDQPTWNPARLDHTGIERINGWANSWPMVYYLDKDMQPIPPPGNVYNGEKNIPKFWTFPGEWPPEKEPQTINDSALVGPRTCMDYGTAYVPPAGYKYSCKHQTGPGAQDATVASTEAILA